MKFYINPPSHGLYVQFDSMDGITVYNIYNSDGTNARCFPQVGDSTLEDFQLIELGRLLEIHKQVQSGSIKYDPYVLFSDATRRSLNGKI